MEEQKIDDILEELKQNSKNPELVKDNKFYFSYKDKWYRIRMPNQREYAEATQYRNKIQVQLLQKGKKEGYLLKKELIKVLKENDIDIELIEKNIEDLKKEFIQIALSVAKKRDSQEKNIEKLEIQAKEIEDKIKKLVNEKATRLSPAIEYQAEDGWYKLLTSFCTERAVDEKKEKWEKTWKNFEDFQKDDSVLPYVAEAHFAELIQNG